VRLMGYGKPRLLRMNLLQTRQNSPGKANIPNF
jgi:hypothetical protein